MGAWQWWRTRTRTWARQSSRRHWLIAAFVLSATPAHAAGPSARDLDEAFGEAMAHYRLPGLAVGVVEDGRVVYRRAAGELVVGEGTKIDADTVFKIASNSKSMTAATLARLVDAGKLRWDDPVTKHLPTFRMRDAWVTKQMQVRDLLIHNSGLRAGAGDLMLWPEPNRFTRDDVVRAMAHIEPVQSFRSGYAYSNTFYIVAGEVAAAAGGAPYESVVRREVFEPLGLSRCQIGEWNRNVVGNVAQPHRREGERYVVDHRDQEIVPAMPMAAAGGIRCSLSDLLTWAKAWLDPQYEVRGGDVSWLSAEQRDVVWRPQMPMTLTARMRRWDSSHFYAYGYGWRLTDVDGTMKVAHTGTLAGMYSAVTLLPEKKVGIVVLINGDAEEARTVLTETLVKHYTAPETRPTVSHYAQDLERESSDAGSAVKTADAVARVPATPRDLGGRLGRYRDPWFGEIDLCPAGDAVRFTARKSPSMRGRVMRAGSRWLVDWDDDAIDTEPWLTFGGATSQHPGVLTLAKVDPEADFSYDYEDLRFTRVRNCN